MDIRKIRKLIELLQETDLYELEVKEKENDKEESVRIARIHPGQVGHGSHAYAAPVTVHTPYPPLDNASSPLPQGHPASMTGPGAAAKENPLANIKGHVVTAPMVGTLYISPSPGAKPFVEAGKNVQAGETLCIIEAMKMFNEIEADKSGTITAFLVENGQPVEFGQPICVIE